MIFITRQKQQQNSNTAVRHADDGMLLQVHLAMQFSGWQLIFDQCARKITLLCDQCWQEKQQRPRSKARIAASSSAAAVTATAWTAADSAYLKAAAVSWIVNTSIWCDESMLEQLLLLLLLLCVCVCMCCCCCCCVCVCVCNCTVNVVAVPVHLR